MSQVGLLPIFRPSPPPRRLWTAAITSVLLPAACYCTSARGDHVAKIRGRGRKLLVRSLDQSCIGRTSRNSFVAPTGTISSLSTEQSCASPSGLEPAFTAEQSRHG